MMQLESEINKFDLLHALDMFNFAKVRYSGEINNLSFDIRKKNGLHNF